jgi:hypothetical protein
VSLSPPSQVLAPAPSRWATGEAPLVTNELIVQPEIAPADQAQRSWTPSPLGLQAAVVTSMGRPAAFRTVQVSR